MSRQDGDEQESSVTSLLPTTNTDDNGASNAKDNIGVLNHHAQFNRVHSNILDPVFPQSLGLDPSQVDANPQSLVDIGPTITTLAPPLIIFWFIELNDKTFPPLPRSLPK